MKIKPFAANLAVAGFSVLIVLALLEVGARILVARRPTVTAGEQGVYSQTDPLLGWKNRPGTSVQYNRREYSTKVEINALGFRDVERSAVKAPGFGRIVAIGDSFIEAYTVERDESVTRRAEAISLKDNCQVDVVNAGVHGYSTDQEALWFLNNGASLSPDVVVVFAYYNDILNNIRGNYWGSPKPMTDVVDGRLVVTNLPLPQPSQSESQGVVIKPPPPPQGSVLKGLITERLVVGAPAFYNRLAALGLWDPWEAEPIPDELRAYKARGQLGEFDEAWAKTRGIFEVLAASIRSVHAVPVLVHIPARFEVSQRDWELTTLRYGIDPRAWDRTLVRQRLQEIATASGWSFLDLTPALEQSIGRVTGEPYFPFDGHWNARGHDVAAQRVVDFLKEKRLLPCGGAVPAP